MAPPFDPRREIPPVRGKTSPYGFFVKMCYEEHKKKYPDEAVQVTEISKRCSEKWKTMTEEEKRRFYELAQKDAERYAAEVQAYGGEDTFSNSKRKRKQKKDPNAPKKALSAFFFFSNEKRTHIAQLHPEWKVGQIAQEMGRAWKEISPEEKKLYDQKAADDKLRYEEDMRTYREQQEQEAAMQQQQHQQQLLLFQQQQQQQQQRQQQQLAGGHTIIMHQAL